MRRALIIGNWKMHKTMAQAVAYARELTGGFTARADRDVAIAPPFTALHALRTRRSSSRSAIAPSAA